jgi:hypothetical protein
MSLNVLRLTMIFLPLVALLVCRNVRALAPPATPLAVRSPYLNCWVQFSETSASMFGSTWPTTFNSTQVCHPYILSWR